MLGQSLTEFIPGEKFIASCPIFPRSQQTIPTLKVYCLRRHSIAGRWYTSGLEKHTIESTFLEPRTATSGSPHTLCGWKFTTPLLYFSPHNPQPMLMLSPTPLPRVPHSDEEWKKTKTDLDYSGAYDFVLKSEVQAEAGDQIIHARVAGYLLIELFDRQGALTLEPYRCVVGELMAKARTPGGPCELVFDIGKMYRDRLLRLCVFHFFPTLSTVLISRSSDN